MNDAARREAVTRQAHETRGVIINHYATIEFGIDELIYRARRDPAYFELINILTSKGKIPNEVSQKIEICRKIFAADGPLKHYENDVVLAVNALSEFSEIRHLAAHGLMIINFHDGEAFLSFTKFTHKKRPDGGYDFGYSKVVMDRYDVDYTTARLSLYARTVSQTLADAIIGANLPDLADPDD